ncbi:MULTISPECIES: hypothetical protein [unclassified Microbacterium]|uniref:hypothetical protein n=1 Tax=unclassified Microbacterium TaxID=2609290 RepID=UPI00097EC464|nr:hypothetical protein [Microbacterium sp. JB110]RCS57663.1 large exoprotein [Microbacterium sp. JB110]SJM46056.1 Membrane protein [Frigoribacterium sp. JB110]
MGGQVLGGGVVVLVAVLLWLLYLLPSIMRRSRYDASERNALRLNRALRVLAETSETPEEVRVELTARQARSQQKAARRAQAEVERLQREREEIEAEQSRLERERELADIEERRQRLEAAQAELDRREAERELDAQRRADAREADAQKRLEARSVATAREERRATRERVPAYEQPEERDAATAVSPTRDDRATARRRVRLAASLIALSGIALTGWGAWVAVAGAALSAWAGFAAGGIAVFAVAVLTLRRMARVARRASDREQRWSASGANDAVTVAVERDERGAESRLLNAADRGWTPRRIPAPLSTTAGSQAASVAAAQAAREELLRAAEEEALREKAERMRPEPVPIRSPRRGEPAASVPVDVAEPASTPAASAPEPSRYAAMGYVDDAEIEQHVRTLLARRAAG